MSARLHKLKPPRNDEVVAMCRRLLDRARKGELRSFAFAAETTGQGMSHGWTTERNTSRAPLHLAVCQLARRMEMPEVEQLADLHGIE